MLELVKKGLVLFMITAVTALLLGFVNVITKDVIEDNQLVSKNETMCVVLSGGSDLAFAEGVETGNEDGVTEYFEATSASGVYGYAITSVTKGYGGDLEVLVGINMSGVIEGVKVTRHSETPGLGAHASDDEFSDQYKGKSEKLTVTKGANPSENEIAAITSATITSKAVTEAVNAAIEFFNAELAGLQEGGAK